MLTRVVVVEAVELLVVEVVDDVVEKIVEVLLIIDWIWVVIGAQNGWDWPWKQRHVSTLLSCFF